jgi:glycosyltransferase involved in cell wall biosynthesis
MALVSVVIPCYNSHQYLNEAIESINKQTFRDIEIIVVDDGSNNPETVNALNNLDSSVNIIRKENGGLASARNYGIRASVGEIIVALDSDDKFDTSFIEKAVHILNQKPEIGIVSSYVKEFGTSSKVWRPTAYDDFSFFTENRLVACCAFRKKCWEAVNGFDEKMRSGYEDWEFWIRVTQKGWKVHIIPEKLFFYRKSNSSMLASETKPKINEILNYMIAKNQEWYIASLKKGIAEKKLINKQNLTVRRIIGLLFEKITGKF